MTLLKCTSVTLKMTNYDPPYKTMFFLCYSTVAAIVATEAGLLAKSDSYIPNHSPDAFVFGHEWYLVKEKQHPWCGTFLEGEWEVGSLVYVGDDSAT